MSMEDLKIIARIGRIIVLLSVICVTTVSIVKKDFKTKQLVVVGISEVAAFAVAVSGSLLLLNLTGFIRNEWGEMNPQQPNVQPEYEVLHSIYLAMLYFICFMTVVVLWKSIVEKEWIKEYLLYILIPVYQLVLIVVYFVGCDEITLSELQVGLLLTAFSLFINYCIIYLVTGTLKKIRAEKELKTLNEQRLIEAKYYEMTQQNMQEMKELRLDYGNQLQEIYALLERGEDTANIQKLIDVSNEKMKKNSVKRYCGNSIANAILAIKLQAAEEQGIRVECECRIAEQLKMEMIDLCSLLTNLIDNAVEACENMPADSDRWIRVHAGERAGVFGLKVENSYSQPVIFEKGQIVTSKNDKKNHGYGLRLVKEITSKYDGSLDICAKDNVFSTFATIFSGGG